MLILDVMGALMVMALTLLTVSLGWESSLRQLANAQSNDLAAACAAEAAESLTTGDRLPETLTVGGTTCRIRQSFEEIDDREWIQIEVSVAQASQTVWILPS